MNNSIGSQSPNASLRPAREGADRVFLRRVLLGLIAATTLAGLMTASAWVARLP